jgi:hypothetical protein
MAHLLRGPNLEGSPPALPFWTVRGRPRGRPFCLVAKAGRGNGPAAQRAGTALCSAYHPALEGREERFLI